MVGYIIRRIGSIAVIFSGILALTFMLSRILPGEPARLLAGPRASAQAIAKVKELYGLDLPLYAEHHHPINLNIGEIEGGDWPSSVPGWCTIDVRVGIYPGQLPKNACREIEDVIFEASTTDPFLAENPPQISYHGYLAEGCVLEGAEDAEALLTNIHTQICGGSLGEFLATGLTDGRFFALYQDTPALNYGPKAENYHGYDERVDIASIKRVTKTMALFIAGWCQLEAL
ncbi:MAG: hypothetical protein COA78_36530 [Blastopirellula sp.]|nr:MAG: hypothetical protein COA78_36530 [Blastopirellula sp.]